MTRYLRASLRRQWTLACRRPLDALNPALFFAVVVALFPLGLGPNPARLAAAAPGLLWVVALLATLMAAESLFRPDYEDGSLEQAVLAPRPLYLFALSGALGHWLLTGLPLTLLAPLFALMLHLPAAALPALLGSMALGTAILSLVGGIGAALTVPLRRGGLLVALIVMPLHIPVLIFGSAAVQTAVAGYDANAQLLLLAGMLLLAIALAPLAMAAGLRLAVEAA